MHRRQRLDPRAEPPLQQLVRREEVAAKICRNEEKADDDAADDVAQRELQERHVAGIGGSRDADERQRAGFGRDNREADGPPGHAAVGQKIVARRVLKAGEPGSEGGDGGQVAANHQIVRPRELHMALQVSANRSRRPCGRARPETTALLGGFTSASYEKRITPAAFRSRAAAICCNVATAESW